MRNLLKNTCLVLLLAIGFSGCQSCNKSPSPATWGPETSDIGQRETATATPNPATVLPLDEGHDQISTLPEQEIQFCQQIFTPFQDTKRQSMQSIHNRFVSWFGAPRQSYVKGHLHSAIDLKGKNEEIVYPIGVGVVLNRHLGFPHKTLVIEHFREDGTQFLSAYKHIEEILVEDGQWVDENTPIARLFTAEELKESGFVVNHLHLEIRKNFDDQGRGSFTCMSMEELEQFFYDPMDFYKSAFKR